MRRRIEVALAVVLVGLGVGLYLGLRGDDVAPEPEARTEEPRREDSVRRPRGTSHLADRVRAPRQPLRLSPTHVREAAEEIHGAFAGEVRSHADDAPVADAELTFEHAGATFSTRTTGEGRFFLRPPEAGTYSLAAVTAEGFQPFAPAWGHSPRSFTAIPRRVVEGIVIHLVPQARYLVEVVSAEGEPVEGAEVTLRSLDDAALVRTDAAATTDVRGEAEIDAVDDAIVEARHPDHGVGRARVNLRAQIERTVRVRFDPRRSDTFAADDAIAGVVRDEAGHPVADALVAARHHRGGERALHPNASALTDAEGRFRLEGLDAGRYALRAAAEGHGPGDARGVEVGREDVEIVLGSEGRIRGRVAGAEGPASGFAVVVERMAGELEAHHAGSVAEYDPEGRFEIEGLASGRYRVTATAPGAAPAEATTEVRAGSTSDVGTLELGAAGSVRGLITSRELPVVGARVRLEGRLGNADLPTSQSATTDASGTFVLGGLAPGRRSLVVVAEDHHARIQSGVVVTAGTETQLEIALRPLEEDEEPSLELAGIGARLGARGDDLFIWGIVDGGGAQAAGLARRDQVLAVDGVPVSDLGFQGAIERIRGPEGSEVVLTVRRGEEELVFRVRRVLIRT